MLSLRDLEYIDHRLQQPADGLLEAIWRLRKAGYTEEAERLMESLQRLNEKCQLVRKRLHGERYEAVG